MGRRDLGAGQEQLLQGSGSDASRIQAHEQHGIAAAALGEGLGAGAAMDLGSGARRDWPEGGGFGHANGGEEPIAACGNEAREDGAATGGGNRFRNPDKTKMGLHGSFIAMSSV